MGLFDFNAAADPSDPSSYAAQQLRQRIALQMLGRDSKKGYPKTLGEGLTAIGDALGERGQMNMLERQFAAQQAASKGLQTQFPPVKPQASADDGTEPTVNIAGDVTDNAAPVQTADAAPTPGAAPPVLPSWGSGAVAANNLYQPTAAPEDAGDTYPQTALNQTGGTMSDAPPIGVNPVRNAIAARPMNSLFPAPGVPQPNPTQAGPDAPLSEVSPASIPPSTLAALQATSPAEAADNRPIETDIPLAGAQVAQANTGAYSGSNLGPLARPAPPLPTIPDPAADPRPTPPSQPKREPESKDQQRYTQEAIRRQGLGDNPANVKYLMEQAAELEKERAFKDAANKAEYEKALERHNQADAAWRTRQSPASRAEEMAKIEEANIVQRTGRRPEQFYPEMTKEQNDAVQAGMAQNAQQLARKAIRDGVIVGYGSNFRVAADKFANWALKNGMGSDMAANTEIMSAALKSGLKQAIDTINQGGKVSDTDVRIAQGIQGTDPELQMKTIKALMDRASEINNMKVDRYEGMVHNYLGAGSKYGPHPQEQTYATTPTPVTTPDKLKLFLDSQKEGADPAQAAAYRRFFDESYGPGAAQLEISRHRRRGGR